MFKNNILKSLDYNKGHWDLANMRGWNRSRENPRMSLWTCPQNPLTSSEKIHPHIDMMPSLLGVKVKTPQHPANKVQIRQASQLEAPTQWGNGKCHLWGTALGLGTIIGILRSMVKCTHPVMKATGLHRFVSNCIQSWGCWHLTRGAIYLVQGAHMHFERRSKAWGLG